jgi:hypothetical protein
MPNTVLNPTAIRTEIMSRLGAGTIDVEIKEADLAQATAEAVRNYTRYRPQVRRRAIAVTTSQKRYQLDLSQHPGLVGILDVQFITRRSTPSAIDVFDPTDSGIGNLIVGNETYGDIAQRLSHAEDAGRVISAEPDWTAHWEGPVFALYVDIVRDATQVSYAWTANYTPDANANTGMQLIPDPDTDWVLDYIEARCKKTLGMIRRKFGGIPNSEGSTDELDGQALVDEGQLKIESLIEDLKRRTIPIPPVIE